MSLLKSFLMVLCLISFTARGQSKIKTKDSIDMKTQIEGFYSWYINMIKNGRVDEDFNPSFVKSEDGMTTLDFKKYKDGLRKYRFADDFIERKVKDYKTCVDNLKIIPFDKFSQYTDLDDFESIKCDFNNRYEWTGGQEPKGKAILTTFKRLDSNTVIGQVSFTSYDKEDGTARVTFKKSKKNWRVNDIQLE